MKNTLKNTALTIAGTLFAEFYIVSMIFWAMGYNSFLEGVQAFI